MMEINLIDNLDRLVIERDKQNELEKKKRERDERRIKNRKIKALVFLSWIVNLSVAFCGGIFLGFYKVILSTSEDLLIWSSSTDIGVFLFVITLIILLLIFVNYCIKQLK